MCCVSAPATDSLSEGAPAVAGAPVPARRRRAAHSAANLSLVPAPAGVAVEVVIPVYNEEHVLAESVLTLHEHMAREFTLPVPDHDRRQRERRRDPRDRPFAGEPARARPLPAPGAQGPRTRAAGGLERQRGGRARLHGRRPVHRPQRAGRPARARCLEGRADVMIGSRLAPGRRGHPGSAPGGHLALLQHPPADLPRARHLRRPVRLQGDPPRGPDAAAGPRPGRLLVLRHRAPLPRPPQPPRDPRGPRALGRGHRTPAFRSSRPCARTCRASTACAARGRRPPSAARAASPLTPALVARPSRRTA